MGSYRLEALTRTYGERQVLNIPDLSIQHGELLVVVGPSGAGKSTLLRLLHYLEAPSTGRVIYTDNNGREFAPTWPAPIELRRKIGMVFQRPEMIHGTLEENVGLGLRFRGLPPGEAVEAAIAQVELKHLKGGAVDDFSGGELQRAAIARVIAIGPEVVLFDEPTANLDPTNVAKVETIIRNMQADGATIVLVTHNVFQARRLADRVAFLLDGRLIEVSERERFFTDPEDPRASAFVAGEMVY